MRHLGRSFSEKADLKLKVFFRFLLVVLFSTASVAANATTCEEFKDKLNLTEHPHNKINATGEYELDAPYWFNIRKLKDIDLKKNIYTADYKFRVLYLDPRLKDLGEALSLSNGFFCPFQYEEISHKYRSLEFYTTSIEDLKVTNDTINFNFVDGDFFIVRLIEKTSTFSTTNALNFSLFPFDSHRLDIRLYAKDMFLNDMVSETQAEVPIQLIMHTDEDMSRDPTGWLSSQIFGWHIKDYELNYQSDEEVVIAEIELERDPFFYIVKIVFPVILVVLISWSVFLMHPRSIEARVNVTIVSLLALIAYNFVIDDALPKVPYLTVLDAIILASYLFSGLATIYSIISYRAYITSEGDNIQLGKTDRFFRNNSLLIYALLIAFIIGVIAK